MRRFTQEKMKGSRFEERLVMMFGSSVAATALYIMELIEVVIISLAIIMPIRWFLVQPFYVKGASMEPTFVDHEYLVIDELTYRFREPERGEVVVFRYPHDTTQFFIKRVIGLPGETVKVENGKIQIINAAHPEGYVLEEAYLKDVSTSHSVTQELAADQYFLLGDNRPASLDSRFFGPVKKDLIVGRVWIRGWPLDRAQVFASPIYENK